MRSPHIIYLIIKRIWVFMEYKTSIICISLVIFGILEIIYPFYNFKGNWLRRISNNLILGLANAIALSLITKILLLQALNNPLYSPKILQLINMPLLAGILAILIIDLYMYLWHRWMHKWAIGWRFHKVHHTDREMNISTAYRFHIIEILASNLPKIFLIWILGIKIEWLLIYEILFAIDVIFHHSNWYLPVNIDKFLSYIIVTPNYHRLHHSQIIVETNSNYGSLLSIWDKIFLTYRYSKNPERIKLGLAEYKQNLRILDLLIIPFRS